MISNQEGSETVFACRHRANETENLATDEFFVVVDSRSSLVLVMRTRSAVFHTQKPRETDETRTDRRVDFRR